MGLKESLLILAAVLITAGVGFIWWPAALIVAGMLMAVFMLLSE